MTQWSEMWVIRKTKVVRVLQTRNRSNFILTNALAVIWSTVTEMMETKFHLDFEIAKAENVFKLRSEKVCRGKLVEMFTRS